MKGIAHGPIICLFDALAYPPLHYSPFNLNPALQNRSKEKMLVCSLLGGRREHTSILAFCVIRLLADART